MKISPLDFSLSKMSYKCNAGVSKQVNKNVNLDNAKSNFGLYSPDKKLQISFKSIPEVYYGEFGENELFDILLNRGEEDEKKTTAITINNILNHLNNLTIPKLSILLYASEQDGKPRFYCRDISWTLAALTKENSQYLVPLLNAKTESGEYRFDAGWIGLILSCIKKDNAEYFDKLLNAKDDNGEYRFDQEEFRSILGRLNAKNSRYLDIMLNARDDENNLKYDCNSICEILNKINTRITEYFEIL